MKKFYYAINVLALMSFPLISHAAFVPRSQIDVTVVINTDVEDGTFHFDIINGSSEFEEISDSWDITTLNKSASYTTTINGAYFGFGSSIFEIKETIPEGWEIENITCTADTAIIVTTPYDGMGNVLIQGKPSQTTCIFENVKESQSKTPVLIVPGMMGTVVKDVGDRVLWADPIEMLLSLSDHFIDPLAFDINLEPSNRDLKIGSVIKEAGNLNYTSSLISEFKSQGYIENETLFTFPYDWRYGVSGLDENGQQKNVAALKQRIAEIVAQTGSEKVDIIAHSTGGLLVKKYVMENPSGHHLGKTVFVGVPHLGAPKAAKALLQGDNFNVPGLNDAEIKKIARNMPVAYDLLPSQAYFEEVGTYVERIAIENNSGLMEQKDLDYNESKDLLLDENDLNALAFQNAAELHNSAFDNFDLRTAGVDVYTLSGCKTGTLGTLIVSDQDLHGTTAATISPTIISGDRTVPLQSAHATVADETKQFYIPNADHGEMLSADGTRQQIVNIVSGSALPTAGIVTRSEFLENPQTRALNGKLFGIFSPLDISVTDNFGNYLGFAGDGSLENNIPGADFEVYGDQKFVYLPDDAGQMYDIALHGTGAGTFTLKSAVIENGTTEKTEVFSNLPVTTALAGSVSVGDAETTLLLDTDGDGEVDQTTSPSATLRGEESEDLIAPQTFVTLSGTEGKSGFYRSDVVVTLDSADPVSLEDPGKTSGILKTKYDLDAAGYLDYSSSTPLRIVSEGTHTLTIFSTDRAGNNETMQTITFTIDKTPPEIVMQFDPLARDISFSSSDALPLEGTPTVLDADDTVSVSDTAGNTTVLTLKEKNRKKNLRAEIESLSYNDVSSDMVKNSMEFHWSLDKEGNIEKLEQQVKNKKDYIITASYKKEETILEGKDQNGKVKEVFPGLVLLHVKTAQGDLNWTY